VRASVIFAAAQGHGAEPMMPGGRIALEVDEMDRVSVQDMADD